MPQAIPVPLRRRIFRSWQQGQTAPAIARALDLRPNTVRRLLHRFQRLGTDGLQPAYDRCGPTQPHTADEVLRAARRLRQHHPRWGAPLIATILRQLHPNWAVPSARTLQRCFRQDELPAASPGRKPQADPEPAERPHAVWQVDACEQVTLRTGSRVSWLRLVDEYSGAVLKTVVFPPRELE